jgi:thioredoxin-like negative regulator of GroEL
MLWPVLHQLTDEYTGKVKLLKIDVDAAENQELAVQFGISSIPRVIFFVAWNKVDDFVWVQWPDAVKEIIEKHLPKWDVAEVGNSEVVKDEVADESTGGSR